MDRKSQELQLNQVAENWARMPVSGNEAARQSLYDRLFILAFQCYDSSGEMWVLDAFLEAAEKFDPDKGKFSNYMLFLLSRRSKDAYAYDRRHSPSAESLDEPIKGTEDPDAAKMNFYADENASQPEKMMEGELPIVELTALILNFAQRHKGQSANDTNRNWYQIFYTEDITYAVKLIEFQFLHERDVFQAIKKPYLDYYMCASCGSLREIQETPLRPYREVVPRSDQDGETPLPIPADVSLNYLRLVEKQTTGTTRPARSGHKKQYEQDKGEIRNQFKRDGRGRREC